MIVRLSGKCELAGRAKNLPNMVAKSTKVCTKQTGGLIMSRADRLCENRSAFWKNGQINGDWGGTSGEM